MVPMNKGISNRTAGSEKGIKRKDAPDIALRRMQGFEHGLVMGFFFFLTRM
jgi:hypothetical protein